MIFFIGLKVDKDLLIVYMEQFIPRESPSQKNTLRHLFPTFNYFPNFFSLAKKSSRESFSHQIRPLNTTFYWKVEDFL